MLGYRLVQPTPLDASSLAALRSPESREQLHACLGEPPASWADWCAKAEEGLLRVLGLPRRGNVGRGRVPQVRKQQMSRPQVGLQAVGTNPAMAALRLREARAQRLQVLREQGLGHGFEAAMLRRRLGVCVTSHVRRPRDSLSDGWRPFSDSGVAHGSSG